MASTEVPKNPILSEIKVNMQYNLIDTLVSSPDKELIKLL